MTGILLPRITIDAFTTSQESGREIEKLAQNHNLVRTRFNAHQGSIEDAIRHYKIEQTPSNLIIVEAGPNEDPERFIAQLNTLADLMSPQIRTFLIVLGYYDSVKFNKHLSESGVSDYLIAPFTDADILNSMATIYSDPLSQKTGNLISVIGTHGGAGTSTIAQTLSVSLARQTNNPVTLLDLHLGFGTAAYAFNIKGTDQNSSHYTASPESIDSTLLDRLIVEAPSIAPNLTIFPAPASLRATWGTADRAIDRIVDVTQSGSYYLVADLPHGWTDGIRNTISTAMTPLIVTTPTYLGLRNSRELLRAFEEIGKKPVFILNKIAVPKEKQIDIETFTRGIKNIEPAVRINWSPELFSNAFSNGSPANDENPNDPAIQAINKFAAYLLGHTETPANSQVDEHSAEKSSGLGLLKSLLKR